MNTKALHTLEYDTIIARLTEYASTPLGKGYCSELLPSSDLEEITSLQNETADALTRLVKKGSISFSGTRDIRDSLMRLSVGSNLSITELLNIASVLRVTGRVSAYGKSVSDSAEHTGQNHIATSAEDRNLAEAEDSLNGYFSLLDPRVALLHEIDRCILNEDEVSDDASAGLKNVRRQMSACNEKIRSQLNTIMASHRSYLQDSVITMRAGRYCLPVKSENRSMVDGMVHDQSGSGSTLFIEPAAIVRLNNELRELEIKEQKEIEIVLAMLSGECGMCMEQLETNLYTLSKLDAIFARATLAKEMNASKPAFNNRHYINIKKGRHPLIPAKQVVPIDISLGNDYDQLIVTGPNTGGKTVTLKTVGLFTLMGQAGLHIPAFDGSELGIFEEVYADIGDEQSIEQNLSTFSAHMTNIVSFLEHADSESLVLFDELGAGTDPVEGAALAIAILHFLHNMQVRTVATTHYSELKVYALTTDGVMNASCEFDVETLKPTYRLLIGVPGKSNAFAISSKLGLPDYIIEDAGKQLDARDISFEDMLSSLETSRKTIEAEQAEISRLKEETRSLKEAAQKQQLHIDSSRDSILEKAREEAEAILREAKEYADSTIRNVNRITASSDLARQLEKERTGINSRIKANNDSRKQQKKESAALKQTRNLQAKDLHIGDSVRVLSMNVTGTVSTLPDQKGNLFVQMGLIRSQVNIRDLEAVQEPTNSVTSKYGKSKSSISGIGASKAYEISTEINMIGMTVDEAMAALDKYLDDAFLSHIPKVRVVHGRGTGALRKATHQKLKSTSYVSEFHLGEYGEGDSGVTIVTFRNK